MSELTTRFAAYREALREAYVGNECDTDEYGETQPTKGLSMIADLAGRIEHRTVALPTTGAFDSDALMGLVATWATAWDGSRYGGADEAMPIYGAYFDVLWADGEHPYHGDDDIEGLAEFVHDVLGDDTPL